MAEPAEVKFCMVVRLEIVSSHFRISGGQGGSGAAVHNFKCPTPKLRVWGMYLADTLLLQNTELCIVAATRMLFWLQFVCWFICLSATLCQTCYYLARYELANPHWRDNHKIF